jgi:hypothetical protein
VSSCELRACLLLDDIALEIQIGTAVSILKADRLEAYPTFEMPRSPDVATCRQTVEALLAPLPPLGSRWLREKSQRKKGYFFIRLLAMSPPKPNSVPITIMLGSGTAGGEDGVTIATRKPMLSY